MKAVVKLLGGGAELRDVPEPPEPGPDEVRLAVAAAGVCGTDVNIVRGTHPHHCERILGHEIAGRVEVDGAQAQASPASAGGRALPVGTLVVAQPHLGACETCYVCLAGRPHLCERKTAIGIAVDGGFAERLVVPAHLLHVVDQSVREPVAALAEPAAVAFTAILRAEIGVDDEILVVGPGPIGMLVAMVAAQVGAKPTLLGRSSSRERLQVAREIGLQCRVIESEGWPDGRFDVVVDTSGSAGVITHAVASLQPQGRLCAMGFAGTEAVPFPWDEALFRAVDVRFSLSSAPDSWPLATTFLAAEHDRLLPLVHTYPLDRWRDAFAALADRSVVKPVLIPS